MDFHSPIRSFIFHIRVSWGIPVQRLYLKLDESQRNLDESPQSVDKTKVSKIFN